MIRVGLELPAPGSREPVGAWLLDHPGCFAKGSDVEAALADVPRAIERYLRFAAPLEVRTPSGPIEIAERFECAMIGDYEVSASFAGDAGAPSEAEAAFCRGMLSATRPALLAAAVRAGEGRSGDRSVEAMLHHVASAEWWYASRLAEDPERVRVHGRSGEQDARARLASVRAWALERIAETPRLGALERVHRGERWTPRKVLRRYVYHELDHLRELEARAPAEVR